MSDVSTSDTENIRGMAFEQHTATRRAKTRRVIDDEEESLTGCIPAQRSDIEPVAPAQGTGDEDFAAVREASTPASFMEDEEMDKTGAGAKTIVNSCTDSISTFAKFTGASELEADKYLLQTNGNLQKAVELFITHKLSKSYQQLPDVVVEEGEPKPATLLDDALAAARPKKLQKDGDLVIILDIADLSKTYRLRSEDLERASPIFKHELATNTVVGASGHGIKHLFILQKPVADGVMPCLGRKSLDTMSADCEDEAYKQPTVLVDDKQQEKPSRKIKAEEDLVEVEANALAQNDPPKVDWIATYETFIRIIAFPRINPGISHTDIVAALEKIELVAQIAKATQAVSSISVAVNNTFLEFVESQQLWSAIARDAARWLLVGINLENLLIYNEAFTHVAGCYPEWHWSVPQKNIPYTVLESIATKSLALDQTRKDVERKVLCQTLTKQVDAPSRSKAKSTQTAHARHQFCPIAFSIISVFRAWIAVHLKHLDSGDKGAPKIKTAICDHDGGECLSVAGFHRLIQKGGDAYMPVETLLKDYWDRDNFPLEDDDADTIRSALKTLKGRAAGLVAPLLESRLKFEGKEKLDYLTAVEVSEEDVPWDTKSGGEASDEDDMSDI
ncbi:hypothetical protein M409DRAFT_18818 [Zasmidium cellare ATCC 36951]|uniref:UBA domain-containing protein n=1 Tax=Zasmidium cellare ATCC 36951 TaxID=1080233 RepID=A0A6A6CZP4_ZASCE|nr:uncharacterized protein M409DRAFT_18818 [Zasmidium cellare ATCC 36951]KAF2170846.1 hypothetical protein M409DRAFT_18818 [Zasmidium cellare ATCC 36951]